MGLLTDENRVKFCFLENNKRMQRSLKELDKVNAYVCPRLPHDRLVSAHVSLHERRREVAKIGLIFVREGQNHQHEILKNEGKSKDYADFVQSLGWIVRLPLHHGYLCH